MSAPGPGTTLAELEEIDELADRRASFEAAPPHPSRERTALERAAELCDAGSFVDVAPHRRGRGAAYPGAPEGRDGDGVVAGHGTIDGRPTVVISHDFSVAGGSIGAAFADKVMRVQRLGIQRRWPIVYLNDSGGARVHEGIEALHGCGGIMALNVAARRVVPQVSVILGPCAGAAAYSPALTDWTVMVPGASQMFLTGPAVVRAATGEDVEPEVLGGAAIHSRESNVAHLLAADETRATAAVRRLLSFLPRAVGEVLPRLAAPLRTMPGPLDEVLPASPRAPFDMWRILDGVLDGGDRLELMSEFAPAMITALARLDGVPVGVVASQPARRGGILDSRGAAKVARFVAFCGRFGLPILTFVDVPGFLPGTTEERRGVINHGASMLAAYVEAPSPKLTVIVRKAYGGAYIAMGSRSVGADFTWAWPGAEVAVMGPEAAVGLLHRRELASAANEAELRAELAAGYRAAVTNPFVAAEAGIIDEVIYPGETRARMAAALRICLDPG